MSEPATKRHGEVNNDASPISRVVPPPWQDMRSATLLFFHVTSARCAKVLSCSFPSSIRTTLTGLTWTCHELFQTISTCREGLNPRNFIPVSWSTSTTFPWQARDIPDTFPRGCHGESRCNGVGTKHSRKQIYETKRDRTRFAILKILASAI